MEDRQKPAAREQDLQPIILPNRKRKIGNNHVQNGLNCPFYVMAMFIFKRNISFILTKKGVVCFELHPSTSSSTLYDLRM